MALSAAQLSRLSRDGFVTVPGFWTAEYCRRLVRRANEIVDAFDEKSHRTVFTTNNQSRVSDEYFMNSAANVSCFFEEHAFDGKGALRQEKRLSINKIGHAMHDVDDVFREATYSPSTVAAVRSLFRRPTFVQSMYIFKVRRRIQPIV